ncbi:MAG: hypothetical protein K2G02_02605 [Phocaeicola sp.]|uniref:hypothetical protein n=1 Tax=Phocaeicola sp. TaxID=2773926 RepID=UPI0023C5FB1C|nr:hypothetical protein [Phocaeicola sp.]MDE5677546.1 hypothetical protein [Phocaeicola sp.]MDE6180017.1 hypothetical protein [Phocaeicola sp.]
MKRFASHYLYVLPDTCHSLYVVELEDNGRLKTFFPLAQELCATQWIGGVIVISPFSDLRICSGERFADFLVRVVVGAETGMPMYAWHIAIFDCAQKEFVAGSKAIRLG